MSARSRAKVLEFFSTLPSCLVAAIGALALLKRAKVLQTQDTD
jgi:hypothetical protein